MSYLPHTLLVELIRIIQQPEVLLFSTATLILTWNFDPPVYAHPIVITECVPFVVVPDLDLDNKKKVML